VTGAIINHRETLSRWHLVFFLAAGINIGGNIFYLIFGTAEEQKWNNMAPPAEEIEMEVPPRQCACGANLETAACERVEVKSSAVL
jgi:hypothetical protein